MGEIRPFITEEQAAALREAIVEAFKPVADAAKQMAAAYIAAFGKTFRDAKDRAAHPE